MKPFLLLGTRADDDVADNEYEAFLGFTGLDEPGLRRHRLEAVPLGALDLDDWSGIFMGGGPFNSSDPADEKSATQRRVEAELDLLLDDVVARDFPLLGACYGIGAIGTHQGAVVDRTFSEPIGRVPISLTPAGVDDQLFKAVPTTFEAFVGHKEAVRELPAHATLLAWSAACPVQAFRIGQHVYATQFHPELDELGVCTRIEVYKDAGYFDPGEAETLKERSRAVEVTHPMTILANFVERHRR